jgi:hypothetical protein
MRNAMYRACSFAILIFSVTLFAAQTPAPAQNPQVQNPPAQNQGQAQAQQKPEETPTVDGGSGPCTAEFTVTDASGQPVYAVRLDMHLAYGFAGAHKLDLGVYTNSQGKARFTGIPLRVKRPPVEYRAKKDDLVGVATVDPYTDCQAKHDIVLAKEKPATK